MARIEDFPSVDFLSEKIKNLENRVCNLEQIAVGQISQSAEDGSKMIQEHHLKCWSAYFEAVERGDKNFEVRRDDRGFQKGDVLVLEKWNPDTHSYEWDGTGFGVKKISIRRRITYVLTGGQLGIEAGYVVLALGLEAAEVTNG